MTYQDLTEAIAVRLSQLWPGRMIYRDFCPVNFMRPSGFLYVTDASWENANIGLVRWSYEAELAIFAATDDYDIESTEALRFEQLAVLTAFAGPSIAVGDRHIVLTVDAASPGPGGAYVTFSASWLDTRAGYIDDDTAPESVSGVPPIENYNLNVSVKE